MKLAKTILSFMLATTMMATLCPAQEIDSTQSRLPEHMEETSLLALSGQARSDALADIAALQQHAPMEIMVNAAVEDIPIVVYDAVDEGNGLMRQTTFYNLSGTSRANGTFGGGYTTNYVLAGTSLFKIYFYAEFDVTPGIVNGNRSQSEIWASSNGVALSNISISFRNENTALCYANGSCRYNYQNGRYTGSFSGMVWCTDTGMVTGGESTVSLN